MIQVTNTVKRFDGFAALDGVSLSVPAGSVYGLVGPNGAGKSTLIRCLTGIYRQDEGELAIDGQSVWENEALKSRVAAIADDWYYFPQATIRDMCKFYRGFYPSFSMERYEKCKEVFQIDEKRPLRRLSKGMQKQAAFSTFTGEARINTQARAAWLNMCITRQEIDNNPAIKGYNVPDPSSLYQRIP